MFGHDSSMNALDRGGDTALHDARVIAAHGRRLTVLDSNGATHAASVFGRGLQVVCGDRVRCRPDAQHGSWHVMEVSARRNTLSRSDSQGRGELIAANITLLAVVVAPLPAPDWYLIDRYLAAAACMPVRALLIVNKTDLSTDESFESQLTSYRQLGLDVVRCAASIGVDLHAVRQALSAETSLLVGQSGVGKSSLLRALLPGNEARIGELMRETEGRHTTTATTLHELVDGGELLDSPGVRDFAPSPAMLHAATLGFVEIDRLAAQCRYKDCRHFEEPLCAVRSAVETRQMSARRYESYRRLRRQHDDYLRRIKTGQTRR
jgi:ribosome biogenesis GTPase